MIEKISILDTLKGLYPDTKWETVIKIHPDTFYPYVHVLADGHIVCKCPIEKLTEIECLHGEKASEAVEKFIIKQIELEMMERSDKLNKTLDEKNKLPRP
jgi:hypothetical protein